MNKEHKALKAFMNKELSRHIDQQVTTEEYNTCTETILNALDNVRERIICDIIGYSIDDAKAYIRHQQTIITIIMDDLMHYMSLEEIPFLSSQHTNTDSTSRTGLRRCLFTELNHLLRFMADYYKRYFDHDADVPMLCRMTTAKELEDKLPFIKDNLHKAGISNLLLYISCMPLQDFISNNKMRSTYREMDHLVILSEELLQINNKIDKNDPDGSLHEQLRSINFNTPAFKDYTNQYFKPAPAPSAVSAAHFVPFRTPVPTPSATYTSSSATPLSSVPSQSSAPSPENTKIKMKLTVDQIGHIIYLVMKILSFPDKSLDAICEFVCTHFCSTYTGNIAPGSLRSQVYRSERRTGLSIQSVLTAMLSLSKKRCL